MKKLKTKDGSLSAHIYNQELAGCIKYLASVKGVTPTKLITDILKEYINNHLEVK